jgi:hypothetical protein
MMVTDMGLFPLQEIWNDVRGLANRLLERRTWVDTPEPVMAVASDTAAADAAAIDAEAAVRHAREQKARVAAVRALLQARDGHFDGAERFFREAADLDPSLRLSDVPTYWNLARPGHEAAVKALRRAGRTREASLLASEIDYRHRPHLVRARPQRVAS